MLNFLESDPWLFAIITGVAASLLWAALVAFTKWAGPATRTFGRGVRGALRWLLEIRVTTERRIRRRIARAVEESQSPAKDARHWKWVRDPRPGVWRLENRMGETCSIREIMFDTDAGWAWTTYPNFPARLRDGESLELRGSIAIDMHTMYMSDNPGASVKWVDSHGDEDVVWAPFRDDQRF